MSLDNYNQAPLIRSSNRINRNNLGLSIYSLAPKVYYNTLIKGDNIDNDLYTLNINNQDQYNKVILNKSNISKDIIIKELKSYNKAINSFYKDYWLKAI